MHINTRPSVAPRSLVGPFLADPAPDAQQALKSLQEAGEQMLQGRTAVLPYEPQILEAASQADGLCDVSRQILRQFAGQQLPVDQVSRLLQSTGLQPVAHGKVSANYEHHFDMHYAPGGGFRGSQSYNTPGETSLANFVAYQKPGASQQDPALVEVDFVRPGFVGPTLSGTLFDGRSSSKSLFFTQRLDQVVELSGNTISGDEDCKKRLETVLSSLDQASPIQLHNYTTGYGRVGTSQHDALRVKGYSFSGNNDEVHAGAATLHGMRQLLQVSGAVVPSPEISGPSKTARVLASMALGGAAGAVGTAFSGVHPLAGLALGALVLGNSAALGGYAHRSDSRDFALPSAEARHLRDQQRAARGRQNGLLMGAALCGSAAAGALFGWQGAVVAAGLCAAVESVL